MSKPESKDRIIYFYDALCGWCYGFSPVIKQLYEKYSPDLPFLAISGGMVTGDRIGPIGETAGFIKTAHKTVEQYSGVKFGEAFLNGVLEKGTDIFTSVPPSQLMSAFRELNEPQSVLFAHELQKAIYFDGVPPMEVEKLAQYAQNVNVDPTALLQQLEDPKTDKATQQDFQLTLDLKVSGFPSVFMEHEGQLYRLSTGYRPFKEIDELIGRVLKIKH